MLIIFYIKIDKLNKQLNQKKPRKDRDTIHKLKQSQKITQERITSRKKNKDQQ